MEYIMIQYTAIIRAQKIMFVDYEDSLSKEVSKWSSSDSESSEDMLFNMLGINKLIL